jgi:hypothetical protein
MNMSFLWWFVDPLLGFFLAKTAKPAEPLPEPLDIPTTEVGTNIRVIFGKRMVPVYLAWYGNVRILKIKVSSQGKK